jgi:hypothetical protein
MKNFLKKIMAIVTGRQTGIQSTLFLIFGLISFAAGSADRFWMFMIASIIFSALQAIIDELRTLNNKNNK